MSLETHGFDEIVQLSEHTFNEQMAALFSNGAIQVFDQQENDLFSSCLLFDTPYFRFLPPTDLTGPQGRVSLFVPYRDSFVAAKSLPPIPPDTEISDLDGKVEIAADLELRQDDDNPDLWTLVVPLQLPQSITNTFDEDSVVALESAAPGAAALLGTTIATSVGAYVATLFPSGLVLTPGGILVDQSDEAPGLTPFSLEATILPGGVFSEPSLGLYIQTQGDRLGDLSQFEGSYVNRSIDTIVLVNSDTLLNEVICTELSEAILDLAEGEVPNLSTAFAFPCRQIQDLTLDMKVETGFGDENGEEVLEVTYRNLRAFVRAGKIRVEGGFKTRYLQVNVTGTFALEIELAIQHGEIVPRVEVEEPQIHFTMPWYLAILPGLNLLLAIAITIAERVLGPDIADNIAAKLADAFENIGGIPIPTQSDGSTDSDIAMRVIYTSLSLDERALAIEGSVRLLYMGAALSPRVAARSAWTAVSDQGPIDLEKPPPWQEWPSTAPPIDLRWSANAGLQPENGARVAIIGRSSPFSRNYEGLTVVDVESIPFDSVGAVSRQQLPDGFIGRIQPLLLGVRTAQGRYAKVAARRDGDRLEIRFTTFDRLLPELGITHTTSSELGMVVASGTDIWWEIECVPSFEVGDFVHSGGVKGDLLQADYEILNQSHRVDATVVVLKKLLASPIRFEWTFRGTPLAGVGRATFLGDEINFEVSEQSISLETAEGAGIVGQLTAIAIDARGLRAYSWINLDLPATRKIGGRPQLSIDDQERTLIECFGPAGLPKDPGRESLGPEISDPTGNGGVLEALRTGMPGLN